ncbi:MAG: acyl-[acyl-carrier-protein] thioesterase [Alphaproteobacteria bacterium]|nr:acyl-[acyl-carrier-protein] thioesterase [Alphaproteobacteria bacterium]
MRDNGTGAAGFAESYRGDVEAWECDAFGHMNIAFYGERFADAAASLLFRLAPTRHFRTVSLLVRYRHELRAGEAIAIRSAVLGVGEGAKRERQVRVGHELTTGEGAVAAEAEHVLAPRDAKMRSGLRAALEAATAAWGAAPFAPLKLPAAHGTVPSLRDRVKSWELDETGRLSLFGHVRRFSTAVTHLMNAVGMSGDYIARERRGFATFESRLALAPWQPGVGAEVAATSGFLATGRSSVTMIHDLVEVKGGDRIARLYLAGVHFDLDRRRSTPLPEGMRAKAAALILKT